MEDALEYAIDVGRTLDYVGMYVAIGATGLYLWEKKEDFQEAYSEGLEEDRFEYDGGFPTVEDIGEFAGNKIS